MASIASRFLAAAIAASALSVASGAAATTIYHSDMSNFTADFWSGVPFNQNPSTVDLLDPGGWASVTAKDLLLISDLANSVITLTLTQPTTSDLELRIGYYDGSGTLLSQEVLSAVSSAVTVALGSDLVNPPPVGTTSWRIKLAMTSGTAELDDLSVATTPEPDTAALLTLGLAALAVAKRRSHSKHL